MARTDTLANYITDISNAVREKTGKTDLIKASELDTEIASIEAGGDISEYFGDTVKAGDYYHSGITEFIKKIPNNITMSGTSCAYMFTYLTNITEVPYFDTSGVTTMEKMFQNCRSLKNVPLYNTSDVTNMSNLFDYCYALESIPLFDTSKVTKMDYMISYCTSIEEIPEFDTSNATSMAYMFRGCQNLKRAVFSGTPQLTGISYMFYNCESLEYVEGLDTGNVSQFGYLFNNCRKLHTIPLFDCEKCNYMISAFTNCSSLVNVGGFKNYGKAFTQKTAHYTNYSLEIRSSYITEDSYWNIANTLYDLNITYDVANGGTLYRQYFKIGPTQIEMLQSTERGQEILTLLDNKGWDVV